MTSQSTLQTDVDVVSMSKLRNSKLSAKLHYSYSNVLRLPGARLHCRETGDFDQGCGQTKHSDTKTQEERFKMSDSNLLLRSGYFTATF